MIHAKALAPGLKDIKKQEVTKIGTDDALANTGKLISEQEIQNVKRTLSQWKSKRTCPSSCSCVFGCFRSDGGRGRYMMTGRVLKLSDVVSSPVYATGVGLVLYGMSRQDKNHFRIREKNIFFKVRDRMTEWCSEFF